MGLLVAGNNPAAVKTAERNIFTATAGQTTFTITQGYQAGDIDVFLNGVRLVDTDDYVANNGTTVVLNSGATVGDSVVVVCFRPFQVADFYTKSEQDTRYVNATGDNLIGSTFQLSSFINLQANDANGYPRINGAGSSAQLGLFRSSGGSEGGMFIGANASEFAIFDQSFTRRLIVDQSGRVTLPYQPAFHVRGGPTQAGAQVVQYTTVQSNIGSHYNSTLHRFTAPVTGKYYFIANALKDSNHADVTLYLRKNGGTAMSDPSDNTGTGTYISLTTFGVLELVANDYIEVYIGNGNIYSGYRNFCGYLIG